MAISFVVNCDTQEEIDYYREKLTANGGKESMCGWLNDKYGISWQIVPAIISKLMSDLERPLRVLQVVMPMRKIILEKLLQA